MPTETPTRADRRPRLRLGVVDQTPVRTGGTAEEAVRETLELARLADRLGYSRYWLAEHHSTNSFAGAAPEVLIPAVAAATERIRVGSGGVMLSHHSPLKVAEQFRMLEALHPGRIDLGIGRAPGGMHLATQALAYGRGMLGPHDYPRQVEDLIGWLGDALPDAHPWRKVRAMPRVSTTPELWLLGSGGDSAALAARCGAGYSYAQFISGVDGAELVARYRADFRPREGMPEPRASVGIGVVCADTDEEAQRLALSLQLWRGRVVQGRDRGIPAPEEAEREFRDAGISLGPLRDDPRVVAGDPPTVRDRLLALADHYAVDEVIAVTVTHSREARLRSYQLLAEALGDG